MTNRLQKLSNRFWKSIKFNRFFYVIDHILEEKEKKIKKRRSLFRKIVNFFLYIGIVVLVILLIALGFSQTSTFREYLRESVVNLANKNLNGHISIGKIDGTIFTSLFLRNSSVNIGSDTLLTAETIAIKVSPLRILLKSIYVRSVEIRNAKINFVADSAGILNISKLFRPKPPDTTHSKFPFKIVVADFSLNNVDFSMQSYNKIGSKEIYDNLNTADLRLKEINLSLSGEADIANNDYELNINKFSFAPNLKYFDLKDLSGKFFVSEKGIDIENLKLVTANSNFTLSSQMNDFNLFDSTASKKLEDASLTLNFEAPKFNFDDLSSFVNSTNILKGTISAKIKASGTLKDLGLNLLKIDYLDSHLEAKGKIREITEPDEMFINASFFNSKIKPADLNKLLPAVMGSHVYDAGIINIDTLNYQGNPKNFTTTLFARNGKGSIDIKAALDLRNKNLGYNISFDAKDFDVSQFAGFPLIVNSRTTIKGSGLKPEDLNASARIIADGSVIDGNKLDTLRLSAEAQNKKINYRLNIGYDTSQAFFTGAFDFSQKEKPAYSLNGFVKNLNLADFMSDSTLQSKINFSVDASGDNIDLDKANLYLDLNVGKSVIRRIPFDSVRAIVDIRSNDKGERIINLVSDLADITVQGKFSIKQTISLLSNESRLIAKEVKYKLNEIFQPQNNFGKQIQTGISIPISKKEKTVSYSNSNIKYQVEFKNLDLISIFMNNNHLSLSGNLNGEIKNNSDSIYVSLTANFDFIKFWTDKDVFFTSGLNMNINLSNNFSAQSLRNINTNISLSAGRIFSGSDIHDLSFKMNLFDNVADLKFAANVQNNIGVRLAGKIDFMGNILQADFDSLALAYNQFTLRNKGRMSILYSQDRIDVKNFTLERDSSSINVEGFLARTGNQNLNVTISKLSGFDIGTNLFGLNAGNHLDANLNLTANITGNFSAPVIKSNFDADGISFRDQSFGFLKSQFNYADQNLNVDVKFLDSTLSNSKSILLLTGDVPIDLAFTGVHERIIKSKQMDLNLTAQDYNLSALGTLIPKISKLKGIFNAGLKLTGTPDNPIPFGQMAITNADFFVDANNLEYNGGLKISLDNHSLLFDSLLIANSPGTKNGGTIHGSGQATLNNFSIASSQFKINGELKVLSEDSKSVSPAVYGELVIATNGDIEFTADSKGEFLRAPIIIQNAQLTFPPVQSAYENSSSNFIYRYLSDTTSINNKKELDFESLVKLSQQQRAGKKVQASQKSSFDYSIDVEVQKEATFKFVISKELNQNLTALLKGNFQYENIGGRTNAQGELTLLDGSTLEFLKTFDAAGTIRFESELSNPYLNVVATYMNYYNPPESPNIEEKVAVKIRLKGPLKDLSKNFIQDKNNISVYVGADNINNDIADPTKDVSDAVMFILQGQFVSDMTPQQQSTALRQSGAVTDAAASLAGSLLGGFLNHYLGDYVKGVELRNVGSITKFNLVGKYKDFKYTIGGSTDVFQDLSQANIKIEYPIYKSLLLRLERKEAITQTTISNEMINELGLQYKFEF
ncbi:MAG: translocation/assembly module TamB domain-containing protein [Ignavibacteriaceae bacterium]